MFSWCWSWRWLVEEMVWEMAETVVVWEVIRVMEEESMVVVSF